MKAYKILAIAFGATVTGFALATLFTPYKGSKTRRKIYKKGHEYTDYLAGSYDDLINKASHSFGSMESKTSKLAKKGKAEAKKVVADINSKMH